MAPSSVDPALTELLGLLDSQRVTEGPIKIPQDTLDLITHRIDLKDPAIDSEIPNFVERLDALGSGVLDRLDAQSFLAIYKILRTAKTRWERQRGFYILTEAVRVHHDTINTQHNSTKDYKVDSQSTKRAIIGAEIIPDVLWYFCYSKASVLTRRWMGLLLLNLLKQSKPNQLLIKEGPEEQRRKIGHMIMHDDNEVLKLIAGSIVRELLDNEASKPLFWPIDTDSAVYETFPGRQYQNSMWVEHFQNYLDDVRSQNRMMTSNRLYFASTLSIGDQLEPVNDGASIVVTIHDVLSIVLPESIAKSARYMDVYLHRIHEMSVIELPPRKQPDSDAMHATAILQLQLSLGQSPNVFLNAFAMSIPSITMEFNNMQVAQDLERGIVEKITKTLPDARRTFNKVAPSQQIMNGSQTFFASREDDAASNVFESGTEGLIRTASMATNALQLSNWSIPAETGMTRLKEPVISNDIHTRRTFASSTVRSPILATKDSSHNRESIYVDLQDFEKNMVSSGLSEAKSLQDPEGVGEDAGEDEGICDVDLQNFNVTPGAAVHYAHENQNFIQDRIAVGESASSPRRTGVNPAASVAAKPEVAPEGKKVARRMRNRQGDKADLRASQADNSKAKTPAKKNATRPKSPGKGNAGTKKPISARPPRIKVPPRTKRSSTGNDSLSHAVQDQGDVANDVYDIPVSPSREVDRKATAKSKGKPATSKLSKTGSRISAAKVSSNTRKSLSNAKTKTLQPQADGSSPAEAEDRGNMSLGLRSPGSGVPSKVPKKSKSKAKPRQIAPVMVNRPRSTRAAAVAANQKLQSSPSVTSRHLLVSSPEPDLISDSDSVPEASIAKSTSMVGRRDNNGPISELATLDNGRSSKLSTMSGGEGMHKTQGHGLGIKAHSRRVSSELRSTQAPNTISKLKGPTDDETGRAVENSNDAFGGLRKEKKDPAALEPHDHGPPNEMSDDRVLNISDLMIQEWITHGTSERASPRSSTLPRNANGKKTTQTHDLYRSEENPDEGSQQVSKHPSASVGEKLASALTSVKAGSRQLITIVSHSARKKLDGPSGGDHQPQHLEPRDKQPEEPLAEVQRSETRQKVAPPPKGMGSRSIASERSRILEQASRGSNKLQRSPPRANGQTQRSEVIDISSAEETEHTDCASSEIPFRSLVAMDDQSRVGQKRKSISPARKIEKKAKVTGERAAKSTPQHFDVLRDKLVEGPANRSSFDHLYRKPATISFSAKGPRNQGILSAMKIQPGPQQENRHPLKSKVAPTQGTKRKIGSARQDNTTTLPEKHEICHKSLKALPNTSAHTSMVISANGKLSSASQPNRQSSQGTRVNPNGSPMRERQGHRRVSSNDRRYIAGARTYPDLLDLPVQRYEEDQADMLESSQEEAELTQRPEPLERVFKRDRLRDAVISSGMKRLPSSPTAPSQTIQDTSAYRMHSSGHYVDVKSDVMLNKTKLADPFRTRKTDQSSKIRPTRFVQQLQRSQTEADEAHQENKRKEATYRGQKKTRGIQERSKDGVRGQPTKKSFTFEEDPDKTLVNPDDDIAGSSSSSSSNDDSDPESDSPSDSDHSLTRSSKDGIPEHDTLKEWRATLQPHQARIMNALEDVNVEMMHQLLAQEEAVNTSISAYATKSNNLIDKLARTHIAEHEKYSAREEKMKERMTSTFRTAQERLRKWEKKVERLAIGTRGIEMRDERTAEEQRLNAALAACE